ncbi:MAG: hypothetical protein ACYDER_29030, partial [Ktedonobacteraceae bacterium]
LDSGRGADCSAPSPLACSYVTSYPLFYHPFLESLPKKESSYLGVFGHIQVENASFSSSAQISYCLAGKLGFSVIFRAKLYYSKSLSLKNWL